ncbi:topoisomerase II isoform X2 [Wolffia australiana]
MPWTSPSTPSRRTGKRSWSWPSSGRRKAALPATSQRRRWHKRSPRRRPAKPPPPSPEPPLPPRKPPPSALLPRKKRKTRRFSISRSGWRATTSTPLRRITSPWQRSTEEIGWRKTTRPRTTKTLTRRKLTGRRNRRRRNRRRPRPGRSGGEADRPRRRSRPSPRRPRRRRSGRSVRPRSTRRAARYWAGPGRRERARLRARAAPRWWRRPSDPDRSAPTARRPRPGRTSSSLTRRARISPKRTTPTSTRTTIEQTQTENHVKNAPRRRLPRGPPTAVCFRTFFKPSPPPQASSRVAGMEEFLLWGVALAVLVALIARRLLLGRDGPRLPPGPKGWPVVGNLLQLSALPHKDLAAFSAAYGPLVYLRLGRVDAITTDDPDVIREILVHQDDVFASRPRTLAAVHLAYGCGDVALAPLGPRWRRLRRICMEHLLTARRLDAFAAHRAAEARHLAAEVQRRVAGGAAVDLREVLAAFSMNNVTRMLLGKQLYGGEAEAVEFREMTHELFHLLGMIYLGDYLPAWRWLDPAGCEKKMKALEKRIDDFHARTIAQHRENPAADGEGDFVDVLLSLPGLDDVEIKALIQDMIAAATDTSAVTSEWAVAEVIRNPRVQRKIQDELDAVVGRARPVEEADLGRLNYLRCVVRETFRVHPAGPFLIPHESVRATRVMGYDVPAGTRVFVNTYALGRNPRVWDKVEEFLPERHEGRAEISHGGDFKILPFSAGRRKCPGAPLGVVFVLLALATLFQRFEWAPPVGVRAEDVDLEEVYGMTMPKARPLLACARPRLSFDLPL